MRKTLGSLSILILLVIVGGPFGVSYFNKTQFNKSVEQINKLPNLNMKVESYNMGWLESHFKLRFTFTAPGLKDVMRQLHIPGKPELIVDGVVHNGPIIFGKQGNQFAAAKIDASYRLGEKAQRSIAAYVGSQELMQSTTLVDFDKNVQTKFKSTAVNYTNPKTRLTYTWNGIKGVEKTTLAMKKFLENFTVGKFDMTHKDFHLQVTPMTVSATLHRSNNNFWYGDSKLSLDKVLAHFRNEQQMTLDNIIVTQKQAIDNGKLNSRLTYTIAKILAGPYSAGPGKFDIEVNGLDAKSLEEANKQINNFFKNNPNVYKNKSALARMQREILQTYTTILSSGVNLNLHTLSVTLPQGLVEAKGNIKLASFNPKQMPLPVAIMHKTNAAMTFEVPVDLAQQGLIGYFSRQFKRKALKDKNLAVLNPSQQAKLIQHQTFEQVQTWIKQGLLQVKGTSYLFHLTFPPKVMPKMVPLPTEHVPNSTDKATSNPKQNMKQINPILIKPNHAPKHKQLIHPLNTISHPNQ